MNFSSDSKFVNSYSKLLSNESVAGDTSEEECVERRRW